MSTIKITFLWTGGRGDVEEGVYFENSKEMTFTITVKEEGPRLKGVGARISRYTS